MSDEHLQLAHQTQGAWLGPQIAAAGLACVWIPAGARLCLTMPVILWSGD